MENKEDKVCPIKPTNFMPHGFAFCLREKCEWWRELTKECSISAIASALNRKNEADALVDKLIEELDNMN